MSVLIWNDLDQLLQGRTLYDERLLLVWVGSCAPPNDLPDWVRDCACAVAAPTSVYAERLYAVVAYTYLQMRVPLPLHGAYVLMSYCGTVWGVLPTLHDGSRDLWQQLFKDGVSRAQQAQPLCSLHELDLARQPSTPYHCEHLLTDSDPIWGGWGDAPKYVSPARITALSLAATLQQSRAFRVLSDQTLARIWDGGCFDPISGAVFGGSLDNRWSQPLPYQRLEDQLALIEVLLVSPAITVCSLSRYMLIRLIKSLLRSFDLGQSALVSELRWQHDGDQLAYPLAYLAELQQLPGLSEAAFEALGLLPDRTDGRARAHKLRKVIEGRNYPLQQQVHKLCDLLYRHRNYQHPPMRTAADSWQQQAALGKLLRAGELLGHVGWIRLAADQLARRYKQQAQSGCLLERALLLWQLFLRDGRARHLEHLQVLVGRWLDAGGALNLPVSAAMDVVSMLAYLSRRGELEALDLSALMVRLMPRSNLGHVELLARLTRRRIYSSPGLKAQLSDWRYLRDLARPGRLPVLTLLPMPQVAAGPPCLEVPGRAHGGKVIEGRQQIAAYIVQSGLARDLAIFA